MHAAAGGLQRGAAGERDRAVRRQVQVRHPGHRLVQPVTQDLLQKIFGERRKIFAERMMGAARTLSLHTTHGPAVSRLTSCALLPPLLGLMSPHTDEN